jgi:putative membrane-bound dehydrogenase-like protein
VRCRLVAILLVLAGAEARAPGGAPLPTPPRDWKLEVIASAPQLRHPSVVCCAPDGRVFVGEDPMDISLPSADLALGRVLCFHPDGQVTTFADNLHAVFGMQYLDGKLYVLHNPKLTVFTDDPTGVAKGRRDLIESTNPKPWALDWNDHVPANFRLAMDGYLYVAVGDKGVYGAVGTDGRRVDLRGGGILRLRPDGSELEVFSTGVRNVLDVAMNDEDEIFTYDNTDEHQWMGRLTHMVDGGFYGYPYDFIPRRPYTLWMMADYGAGAATGTLCYTDDALPPEYHGNLFLADFGKRNILRVKVERDGATYRAVSREDLFTDVPADFRPVGICFSPDGAAIYICDWQHVDSKENVAVGRLLKLAYTGRTSQHRPDWFVAAASGKAFQATQDELFGALGHRSHAVRMVAQRRIADRGAGSVERLSRLVNNNSRSATARAHALWALDAADGGGAASRDAIAFAVADADSRLRRQALRLIGTRRARESLPAVTARLSDYDGAVRFHAATACGRIGDPSAVPALQEVLADADPWVRYAAWTALNRIGQARPEAWEPIASGLKGPDDVRRQGTSFALRSTYDPQLVQAVAAVARSGEASTVSRAAAIGVLGPLHHKLPEWKGEWWAYHPALSPPPRKTFAWEGTELVLGVLRGALDHPDRDVVLASLDALHEAADADAAARIRGVFGGTRDPEVKRRALAALGACDDQGSVRFLMGHLSDPGRDPAFDGALIETLGRLKAAVAVPMLAERARAPSEQVRTAAFEALVRVGGETASAAVMDLLDDRSLGVRLAAVRAAGDLGDRAAMPKLLKAYATRETRDAASKALAQMPDARAVDAYLEGLASTDFTVRERCKQALREVRDAALPAAEAAAGKGVPDDVVLELRQVYRDHELAKKGRLFSIAITRRHPDEYLNFSLANTGDARAGATIFATGSAGGVGCATCHAVNGQGGTVGPDLSGVGAKFSRRDLAEAVLYPSKAVREGYQQVVVRTGSGQTYAGPIKAETPQELTLHESDGTLRRIPRSDVAVRKDSGLSPMPDSLHAGLTPQQFTDLVSYLESLKTETPPGGKETKP